MVTTWTGVNLFIHANFKRLETTPARPYDWKQVASHKVVRSFQRFDQPSATQMQRQSHGWLFKKLALQSINLDINSAVITRWGDQIECASNPYNSEANSRYSHHPLLALVADWRPVANLWLRSGNAYTSNNVLAFVKLTLENLGTTKVGTFRADSGFCDKPVVALHKCRSVPLQRDVTRHLPSQPIGTAKNRPKAQLKNPCLPLPRPRREGRSLRGLG